MRRLLGTLLGPDLASDDVAWQRAEQLLSDSLTSQQYATYRARGFIEVPSQTFEGRVYRVDGWRPVAVYENRQFVGAVCIRPREHLPVPDVLLARKLMIEGAEEEFLRSGNWLQPAWRPAGAAPTILLVVALLSPWLLQLRVLGLWGVLVSIALLSAPVTLGLFRARMRRRRIDSAPPGRDRP